MLLSEINRHCYSLGCCFSLRSGDMTFSVRLEMRTWKKNRGELNS